MTELDDDDEEERARLEETYNDHCQKVEQLIAKLVSLNQCVSHQMIYGGGFPRGCHSAIPPRVFCSIPSFRLDSLGHSAIPPKIASFHTAHRRQIESHSAFRLLKKAHSVIPPSRETPPKSPQANKTLKTKSKLTLSFPSKIKSKNKVYVPKQYYIQCLQFGPFFRGKSLFRDFSMSPV